MGAARPKLLIDRLAPFPSGCTLYAVVERLHSEAHQITLDASVVEALDETALEALMVIAAAQRERGNQFSIENPSAAFSADLTVFGVTPEDLNANS